MEQRFCDKRSAVEGLVELACEGVELVIAERVDGMAELNDLLHFVEFQVKDSPPWL